MTPRSERTENAPPGGITTRAAVGFACSLLALLLPVAGRAASYRFVVLADSATEVKPIYDKAPSIDEAGSVAFLASTSVFVTDGEDAAVVADVDTECGDGTKIDDMLRPAPDLDGVGRVAYFASIAAGGVSNVAFQRFGLNDAGEIALGVELSNARRLVVRAGAALARLAWRRRDGRR